MIFLYIGLIVVGIFLVVLGLVNDELVPALYLGAKIAMVGVLLIAFHVYFAPLLAKLAVMIN